MKDAAFVPTLSAFRRRQLVVLALLSSLCLVSGCVQSPEKDYLAASVLLNPAGPFSASGVARVREVPGGVLIEISILGAPPGRHGVHLQKDANCYGMGSGHFNPDRRAHGRAQVAESHAGDLGNMEVNSSGIGELEVFAPFLSLRDGPYNALGRALVVREFADDLRTQPHGAAGSIMACGIVALDRRKTNRDEPEELPPVAGAPTASVADGE